LSACIECFAQPNDLVDLIQIEPHAIKAMSLNMDCFMSMQVVNLPPWQFLQLDRPTSIDHNQGGNVAIVEVDLKRQKET